MDAVFTISEHSKNVFLASQFGRRGPNGEDLGTLKLEKPVEVLHNCIDQAIFKKLEYESDVQKTVKEVLAEVPEKFCYLFVGHWLRGDFGEDRKNVGLLVRIFLETFKQTKSSPPALILKTSGGNFSILDKREILKKINDIRNTVQLEAGQTMPNIYVLHGELTDSEMNSLYNHPKIKAHVSFTKGEGFGRPLLEASVSGKPVIASGWSGHMDFLNPEEAVLVGGELAQIHPSSVWDNILIKESSWFRPDIQQAANALAGVYSILFDEWLNKPKKENVEINKEEITQKSNMWMKTIDDVIENASDEDIDDAKKMVRKYKAKIKKFRQCGLDRGGEYSTENLVFKVLRRNGYIEKLFDFENELLNKRLSMENKIND